MGVYVCNKHVVKNNVFSNKNSFVKFEYSVDNSIQFCNFSTDDG